ncbi:hypothetical protein KQX54_017409 [Cotesia glomerata]|uniref:Uncharacterized protein n=1 Tax=Cotesia glomerata TaxID=32391 RepID=A0AAV7HSL3_COTGL|nr:hypothetical protein KQX54_017409 [Cotesia glomerata]
MLLSPILIVAMLSFGYFPMETNYQLRVLHSVLDSRTAMSPKKIVTFLWVVILGVAWIEARPEKDTTFLDSIGSISETLASIANKFISRSPITATPAKNLTSGEDFSDDTSPSLMSTMEDNDTQETTLYVTSTMENSFSEVTLSSPTPSDEDFYSEEPALSSTPTVTEQPTSKKDELAAESMLTMLVIFGSVGVIVSLAALAVEVKKYYSSRRLSYPPSVIDQTTEYRVVFVLFLALALRIAEARHSFVGEIQPISVEDSGVKEAAETIMRKINQEHRG